MSKTTKYALGIAIIGGIAILAAFLFREKKIAEIPYETPKPPTNTALIVDEIWPCDGIPACEFKD